MAQFLFEAVALTSLGGVVGIVVGVGATVWIASSTGWPTVVTLRGVLAAFAYAVLVGIASGAYPAGKAASLYPAAALRHES